MKLSNWLLLGQLAWCNVNRMEDVIQILDRWIWLSWCRITNTSMRVLVNILGKHEQLSVTSPLRLQILYLRLKHILLSALRLALLPFCALPYASIQQRSLASICLNVRIKLRLHEVLALAPHASPGRALCVYLPSARWRRSILGNFLRALDVLTVLDGHRNHSVWKYTCLSLDLKY